MASSIHNLAEPIAALRDSAGRLGESHPLLAAFLLRLIGELLALLHQCQASPDAAPSPTARRRYRRRGKGPMLRDWMVPWHPTPQLRPAPRLPAPRHAASPARAPPWPATVPPSPHPSLKHPQPGGDLARPNALP